MSIYKTAIDKPVTTALIFVAVIIIGIFSFLKLPIDQFPEIDPPYIMVMTTYPGANASEIETNVTKLMENTLNSVDGLKELTSVSKDNMSVVTLEFQWGWNLDEASNDVRSYIEMAKDNLPDGASTPIIFKLSSSSMPIIQFAVTAEESYPGLEKLLDDEVIPVLNQVNGIGNISMSGEPERYVYVDIDQEKLDSYGIPLETVGSAISTNNLNMSSGKVKMLDEQYQLQVRSEYVDSREIGDIVVTTTRQGKQVHVRDLAIVRDTIKDVSLDEKLNGGDGVRLIIMKQSGANTVQICRDVNKKIEEIKKTLPPDVKIQTIYDSSENIQNSINSLEESIMYALLFVVLVVLFFLGRWRATFIIGITIPIALIVAFIYLKGAGRSINIISLCSLTIAIGMVVDDAIVVLENITKHIERGSNPREAAIYATNEVWVSVIATTLVTCAVFVPLTMLSGLAGIMFQELGWIVTITVCTSTTVAITLTPMLCSKLLKAKKVKVVNGKLVEEDVRAGWYQRYVVHFLDKVDNFYANALGWCLNHKFTTIIVTLAFFFASISPMIFGLVGTDFMQQTDNGRLTVNIELHQTTRVEEAMKLARVLETRFEALAPEIELISTTAGSADDAGFAALINNTSNNKIQMRVRCSKKYERERSIFDIAEVLRKEMSRYPEIVDYTCQVSSGMGGNSNTVDVEIYGYDFDQTNQFAQDVKRLIMSEVAGARDIDISREDDRPELKIVVDKEKAASHGLSSATISTYVRNRVNGYTAGYLKEDGDEYNIVVRLVENDRNTISKIENLTVPTPTGGQVKLSELAQVVEYFQPPQIDRKTRQRVVTVSVTPYNTSLGELAAEIQTAMQKLDKPAGVSIRYAGQFEDQQETFGDMVLLGALIILLVYVVMASQFESMSKPFIIMLGSIPFALSGTVLALWITHTTLDMIGALGVVMLVGIAVKNGIVLVDYINLMRERGYELNEAIKLSGESRLRPVLMTAFTTMLGMIPMAVSSGEGSEMWKPMGIVVIGGLLISTVVTLIVVPIFYAAISRHGERDRDAEKRKEYIFMQLEEE
ncbi:MAG: efflux RND transporter permease subunit [Paludibacteraceae bacterium]|nr:efflux RND transporter permease subunit [Paludibacteraceae bacterium]MBQ2064793.1 efflux RND transporter permease subunit [Paludibacteraceae bacterium]